MRGGCSSTRDGRAKLTGKVLAVLLLFAPPSAAAKTPKKPAPTSGLATAAAVVPGLLVHGSGSFVAGAPKTGRTLLVAEGVGLASLLTGGAGLALTGASRRTVTPFASATLVGVGLFSTSFLADLYGVSVPERARGFAAPAPLFSASGGLLYRFDRQFPGRAMVTSSFDYRPGNHRFRLEFEGIPGDASLRRRATYGYAFLKSKSPGSELRLEAGLFDQRFSEPSIATTGVEISVRGRYDLGRLPGGTLHGAFVDGGLGFAFSSTRLRAGTLEASDADEQLLGAIGFGAYLPKRHGEARLYYEHRRDTLLGGFLLPGIPAGYGGYGGVELRWFPSDTSSRDKSMRYGIGADFRYGSALVAGVNFLGELPGGSHR